MRSASREFRFGRPSQTVFHVSTPELLRSGNPQRVGLLLQNIPLTVALATQYVVGISFGIEPPGVMTTIPNLYLDPGERHEFNSVPTSEIWAFTFDLATLTIAPGFAGLLVLETVVE